jgi:hypothetical protein
MTMDLVTVGAFTSSNWRLMTKLHIAQNIFIDN